MMAGMIGGRLQRFGVKRLIVMALAAIVLVSSVFSGIYLFFLVRVLT